MRVGVFVRISQSKQKPCMLIQKKISQLAYQIITDPGFVALPQPLEQRNKKPSTQSRARGFRCTATGLATVRHQHSRQSAAGLASIGGRPIIYRCLCCGAPAPFASGGAHFDDAYFTRRTKIMREGRARAISGVSSNYIADRGSVCVCVCVFQPQARASERKTKDATAGHLQLAISKLVAQLCENGFHKNCYMHIKFIIVNLEENMMLSKTITAEPHLQTRNN